MQTRRWDGESRWDGKVGMKMEPADGTWCQPSDETKLQLAQMQTGVAGLARHADKATAAPEHLWSLMQCDRNKDREIAGGAIGRAGEACGAATPREWHIRSLHQPAEVACCLAGQDWGDATAHWPNWHTGSGLTCQQLLQDCSDMISAADPSAAPLAHSRAELLRIMTACPPCIESRLQGLAFSAAGPEHSASAFPPQPAVQEGQHLPS